MANPHGTPIWYELISDDPDALPLGFHRKRTDPRVKALTVGLKINRIDWDLTRANVALVVHKALSGPKGK